MATSTIINPKDWKVFSNTSLLTSQVDALPAGSYNGYISAYGKQTETGMPGNSNFYVHVYATSNAQYREIFAYPISGVSGDCFAIIKRGSTWDSWVKLPTRAEIDALNSKSNLTIQYTSNSYVTSTKLANSFAARIGNILKLNFNTEVSSFPSGSTYDNTEIGKIQNWSATSQTFMCLAPQNGTTSNGILLINISASGVITMSNRSGLPCDGFYRAVIIATAS